MRGFSLVEVMVSISIVSILAMGILGLMEVGNENYYISTGVLELQQQARQALELMVNELREASGISISVIDTNSDQIVFNTLTGAGIQYYRDTSDANGDGIIDQVIREYPVGTRKVLANRITRLKFTHTSPFLNINITAGQTVRKRPLVFLLSERVALRNE